MLDEALLHLRQVSSEWFIVTVVVERGQAALLQGDLPGAVRWFAETIDLARPLQHMRSLLSAVTGLAGIALVLGQAERAARLLGAVEAAQENLGVGQISLAHYAKRITATTCAALDAPTFARAWLGGRRLALADAVAEALTVANDVALKAGDSPATG
jgi:hypothetical protein